VQQHDRTREMLSAFSAQPFCPVADQLGPDLLSRGRGHV
jgi:hypothetical protein